MNSDHLRAYLLLIVTTLCWGLNAIISRLAVGEISPMQLVMLRWLGVVIILLLFARRQIIRDWPLLRRHLPFLCLMGSFGMCKWDCTRQSVVASALAEVVPLVAVSHLPLD